MKRTIYYVILSILAVSLVYADNIKREFDMSKGGLLKVNSEIGGEIYIRGWDQNKVEVKGDVTGLDPEDYEVSYDVTSTVLEIEIDRPRFARHTSV